MSVTVGGVKSNYDTECNVDYTGDDVDVMALVSYTLDTCMMACSSYNKNINGTSERCIGAQFNGGDRHHDEELRRKLFSEEEHWHEGNNDRNINIGYQEVQYASSGYAELMEIFLKTMRDRDGASAVVWVRS